MCGDAAASDVGSIERWSGFPGTTVTFIVSRYGWPPAAWNCAITYIVLFAFVAVSVALYPVVGVGASVPVGISRFPVNSTIFHVTGDAAFS